MSYKLNLKAMRDPRGVYRTRSLFLETKDIETFSDGTPVVPVFTLLDHDTEGCYSFKKLYVSIADPTEYKQAIKMLGSVEHWDYLLRSPWMESLIKACRKELSLKIESEAFDGLLAEARGAEKEGSRIQAYKAILKEAQDLNEEKVAKKSKTRGRPSNGEIKANLNALTAEEKRLNDDLRRIQPEASSSEEVPKQVH